MSRWSRARRRDRGRRRARSMPAGGKAMRCRSTSPTSKPCAAFVAKAEPFDILVNNAGIQPPRPRCRREGRGLRLHHGSERALGLFRRAGGGEAPGRGEEAGLDHPHLLADGPCRRPAPHRLLREQGRDRGTDQGDGGGAWPAWHPRQRAGADLHRDADDAAVPRRTKASSARCWRRSSSAGSARSRT